MTELQERKIAEKIKNQYTPKTEQKTKLEELKDLDKKVKNPAKIFAYIFGILGSLVLGAGMCLAMKIIGNAMALGIAIGLVGIAMVSSTYFIFKAMLNKRKQKYADKILAKSDELLNSKEEN